MSVRETLLQVAVAALSVVGLCSLFHGLFEGVLCPRELATAVVITRPVSVGELDILLSEARRAPLGRGKRVVLLLTPELWREGLGEDGQLRREYATLVEKYGVTLGLIQDGEV